MSLMLDPDIPRNKKVPKEYNMHISNNKSVSTFIFSEKDMPGYRNFSADSAPMHWINRKKIEKKKQQAHFRRAVPSKSDTIMNSLVLIGG